MSDSNLTTSALNSIFKSYSYSYPNSTVNNYTSPNSDDMDVDLDSITNSNLSSVPLPSTTSTISSNLPSTPTYTSNLSSSTPTTPRVRSGLSSPSTYNAISFKSAPTSPRVRSNLPSTSTTVTQNTPSAPPNLPSTPQNCQYTYGKRTCSRKPHPNSKNLFCADHARNHENNFSARTQTSAPITRSTTIVTSGDKLKIRLKAQAERRHREAKLMTERLFTKKKEEKLLVFQLRMLAEIERNPKEFNKEVLKELFEEE